MDTEVKPCPVCGETPKSCPRMEMGQPQSRIEELAEQGCTFAHAVIEVQERTHGTTGEGDVK